MNKFLFNRIKIDKSLIDQLTVLNGTGIQVVHAIITMAKAMGIETIAEGVETKEQIDILKGLECSQAQGYYLGRPVPAADFEELFIKARKKGVSRKRK
ncbi:EAL domain-containing protein [Dehalobacter sp. DCM]|uniref:EAL domain-containing protein n=1 Tax=Dehalobacter sp. DCM TaxID=2907827 RepID=UPI003081A3E7|nr:EAL domain-containing protein [Dehalobacter sp. DCM]